MNKLLFWSVSFLKTLLRLVRLDKPCPRYVYSLLYTFYLLTVLLWEVFLACFRTLKRFLCNQPFLTVSPLFSRFYEVWDFRRPFQLEFIKEVFEAVG